MPLLQDIKSNDGLNVWNAFYKMTGRTAVA